MNCTYVKYNKLMNDIVALLTLQTFNIIHFRTLINSSIKYNEQSARI